MNDLKAKKQYSKEKENKKHFASLFISLHCEIVRKGSVDSRKLFHFCTKLQRKHFQSLQDKTMLSDWPKKVEKICWCFTALQ